MNQAEIENQSYWRVSESVPSFEVLSHHQSTEADRVIKRKKMPLFHRLRTSEIISHENPWHTRRHWKYF